jgi:2-dehydro-3-deoxyphosphogluconate aldolase/(4S)-4-hydroxy-2-oxoglutarate aldolase
MFTVDQVLATLRKERIVAIVRAGSADDAIAAGLRLIDQGVAILEISLNTPNALTAITALSDAARERASVAIGAGTALTASDVAEVTKAGAQFYVAPVFDPNAVTAARQLGIAAIPGCATATEMWQAHQAGAAAIKLFPATDWTFDGLQNVLRAMPFLDVIPTGGVSVDNAAAWLDAGAVALGVGSALEKPGVFDELTAVVAARQQASG